MVSLDNGHQFGLPESVNTEKILNEKLSGKYLNEIKIKKNTADLLLTFTDNFQLEVLISSTGYETYQFTLNNANYIGMGDGSVSVYQNSKK